MSEARHRQPAVARDLARLAAALMLAPVLVLAACTTDAPPIATPPPTGTLTAGVAPSPTPVATAEPTSAPHGRTSDLALNALIDAVDSKDVSALEALVEMSLVACRDTKDVSDRFVPPPCEGDTHGADVQAFPAGVCNPVWHRDPRAMLDRFVQRAGSLFAVTDAAEGGGGIVPLGTAAARGDTRVIFTAHPAGEDLGYVATLAGGRLVSLTLGCQTLAVALNEGGEKPLKIRDRGPAFATPTPTRTLPTPTGQELAAVPQGTHTGIREIDATIDAVASGDPARIRAVLGALPVQCTHAWGIGAPPPCEASELEATVVPGFVRAACEGAWYRPDSDLSSRQIAASAKSLYAVLSPGVASWAHGANTYELVYRSAEPSNDIVLIVDSGGRIFGTVQFSCGSITDWARSWNLILRGPAWTPR